MAAESIEQQTAVLPGKLASEVPRHWPGAQFGFGPGTRKNCSSAPVRWRCFILRTVAIILFSPRKEFLNWIFSRLTLIHSIRMRWQSHFKVKTTEACLLLPTAA